MDSLLNNSFEVILRDIRKGKCLHELSEKVQTAVREVRSLGKPATVTLTIKINPFGESNYAIQDDITTKLPAPNKSHTLFFATDEGVLTRHDPYQTEMKLTTVNTSKANETESIAQSA